MDTVRLAPKAMFSAAVGWGSRRRWPRALRAPVYGAFARVVGARVDEAELPLDEYETFGDFFARRLRAGVRPVAATDPRVLIAPCDGVVAACGRTDDGKLIQAKGIDYRLDDLVCDPALARTLTGGAYATIYLSPRDYHRVHAPCDAELIGFRWVPGALFPVNPLFSRHIDGLLAINERVVIQLRTAYGDIVLVMVAATGVGNIALVHAPAESVVWRRARHAAPQPIAPVGDTRLRRGDELGAFQLGSTVVMLLPPGMPSLDVGDGETLRFGQRIGEARG